MGRPRKHANGAERQRAYRIRVAAKLQQLRNLNNIPLSEYERRFVQYLRENQHCHQRVIRDLAPIEPDEDLKRRACKDFSQARVEEITYEQAKSIIGKYEWLAVMGSSAMGSTRWCYGLFFGPFLAGACCFGSTSGTHVNESVAGAVNADRVCTLVRGACVHWAHPNSASYLINRACNRMGERGYNIIVAYSDRDANEVGTVYQSSGWLYCGPTGTPTLFRLNGKVYDSRRISAMCRDRRGGTLSYKCSRQEMKAQLVAQGAEFFRGTPKLRYVGLFGDRRTIRDLKKQIRWTILPYPKRAVKQSEATPGSNPAAGFDSLSPLQHTSLETLS